MAATAGKSRFKLFESHGKSIILVPLIIGGAVVVSAIILWRTHYNNARLAAASLVEEAARDELRGAYAAMRSRDPELALAKTVEARRRLDTIRTKLKSDYAELKIPLLLLEGEALLMQDRAANASRSEKRFDEALSLMSYSSGETWLFALLGRARSRLEQGKHAAAAADLDHIMTRNPNFGSAYYWRSLARRGLGDVAGANEDEHRARSLDSWPPLRDFIHSSRTPGRDVLANCAANYAGE